MTQIGSVYTATETARSVRQLIEANLNREVDVSVTNGERVRIVFRHLFKTTAIGTTDEGYEAIVSLGAEDELDTKCPTIVVGVKNPS